MGREKTNGCMRCIECKHFDDGLCHRFEFTFWDEVCETEIIESAIVEPNGFCAWGERKDE